MTPRADVRRSIRGAVLVSIVLLAGCSGPRRSESSAAKSDLSIQVASLDFSSFNRRVERNNVAQLAAVLKREQIDVLAVHGLVRYPSVTTRVDLLTELAAQADLQSAFGEMMNNSGRQTGNAVFSAFPIQSSYSQPFDGVRSASVEAALRATVDAGVQAVSIISAELPSKATAEELAQCARIIQSLDLFSPVIAAGNLPRAVPAGMADASAILPLGHVAVSSGMWYTVGSLKPTSVRTVPTDFGTMLVARFDVFKTPRP